MRLGKRGILYRVKENDLSFRELQKTEDVVHAFVRSRLGQVLLYELPNDPGRVRPTIQFAAAVLGEDREQYPGRPNLVEWQTQKETIVELKPTSNLGLERRLMHATPGGRYAGEWFSQSQTAWHTAAVSDGLRIIITGGTFDKDYDAIRGELTFVDSHLPEILRRIRLGMPVELQICQLIDSLQMSEGDRARVARACTDASESRIVVTHGTDTMVETALLLAKARLPKSIVLTGAMIPYALKGSDAVFNLGSAIAASQTMPHGVYVAMNGIVFPAHRVRKNRERGVFEPA